MGFDDELWDSFEVVAQRVSDGKSFMQEAQKFFQKRAEIERDYSKSLLQLCQYKPKVTETGTLGSAWNTLRVETENVAKAHQALSEALNNTVQVAYRNWIQSSSAQRKSLKQNGIKLVKDVQTAKGNVSRAKAKYEEHRKKQDGLETEMATNPAKFAKRLDAEKKNSSKADAEYREKVKLLADLETRFYDTEMPQILRDMENMERERIEKVAATSLSFLAAQGTIGPIEKSTVDSIDNAVRAIDPPGDLKKFTSTLKTGNTPPPRVEYEPYDPAVGACVKSSIPSSSASTPRNISVNQPAGSLSNSNGGTGVSIKTPTSLSTSSAGVGGTGAGSGSIVKSGGVGMNANAGRGRGAMPFISATPNTAVRPPSSGVAVNNLQPPNRAPPSNPVISKAPATAPPATPPPGSYKVIALYEYNATDEGELSFKAGEEITVAFEDPSGWWEGTLRNGTTGVFPKNHVEKIELASTQARPTSTGTNTTATVSAIPVAIVAAPTVATGNSGGPVAGGLGANPGRKDKYIALYKYAAEADDELTINEGDELIVEDEDDEGWFYGVSKDGVRGKFPGNYCEPADS